MKEPAPPRPRKPPSPQKIRLHCSFGGVFVPRQPSSGEFRYVGGESRIIFIDRRGIGLYKLFSRLSELCPDCSFSLKYQLPESPSSQPELTSIGSDDDVRRMIDDHDRLVAHGKGSRLRVFLCDVTPSLAGYVWPRNPTSRTGSCSQSGISHGEGRAPAREGALRDLNARTFGRLTHRDPCQSLRSTMIATQIASPPYENGIQCFGGIGNPPPPPPPPPPTSLFNEVYPVRGSGFGVGFDQSGGAASSPGQVYNHDDIQSSGPHTTELQYLRRIENSTGGNSSRENSFPWRADGATVVKACLAPVSFSNQSSHKEVFRSHILHGGNNGHLGLSHCRTRNHRYGGNDNYSSFYGICSSNIWGRRIGLNHAAAQRFCDGKSCNNMPQIFPGLRRPRSNISKFVQARADRQAQPIKPTNFGSHGGVLMEQLLLQPAPGQGGVPAVGFEPQKLQGRSANYACSDLSDDVSGSPIPPLLGTVNIGDHLLCNSRIAKPITQSRAPYRNNPFSDVVHCPLKHDESADRAIDDHAKNSYDLDKESGLVKGVKRNDANAVLSCLSFSHCGEDTEEFDANSRSITMMPQHSDTTAESDGIFKPVESLINDNSVVYLSEIKGPLDLPMRRLLSSSSNEVHLPAPASSHGRNYVRESDDFVPSVITSPPRDETRLQLNNMHLTEENSRILGQLNQNIAGDTMSKDNIKGGYAISDENAVGSCLLWKSSHPSRSSLVAQVSLGPEKELTYNEQDQETVLSATFMEEKVDVSGSTSICSKEANGIICKIPSVYSGLAMQELQTIKNSDLEEIRELGLGTYGTVFYGKWKGSDVAIKRLKPSCFARGELRKERMVADFWKEACLLSLLHHPNVVAFYGVVTDGPITNLATVTEYMVNGSLKQVLQRKDRTIDRRKRLIIAMDAAFGMEYIHEKNIVHFDLKSSNFFVNMRDPQRPICKIGDLGLSKVKQRTLVSGGVRGTLPWMAPELLTSKKNMVTEKVDVYSYGIVMWELLTGEEPYENMHTKDIIAGIIKGHLRPEVPTWCDPAWRSLMERCWSSDPASRPCFSDIAKELRAMAASINIK